MELVDPVIPPTDHEVQQGLRLLEVPIVVFAETAAERRFRLHKLMIEGGYRSLEDIRDKQHVTYAGLSPPQSGRGAGAHASATIVSRRGNNKEFSSALPALVEKRTALLPLTMRRAECRVAKLKEAFVASPATVRPAHQAAVNQLRRMRLTMSVRNVKMKSSSGGGDNNAPSSLVGALCVPFTSCAALPMIPHDVVTGSVDGLMTLWNTDVCQPLASVSSCDKGWGPVQHLVAHPKTPLVFSTTMFDYGITAWRITEGGAFADNDKRRGILEDTNGVKHSQRFGLENVGRSDAHHISRIRRLAVDPTGTLLASTSDDSTVCLWDADVFSPVGKLQHLLTQDGYETARGTLDVCFHPDGSLLSTTDRAGRVVTWDIRSGKHAFTTAGKYGGHLNACTCVSWSPCGVRFASGGADNLVYMWDARYLSRGAADAPCILVGHEDVITSLSFYANPTFPVLPSVIVSTSLDGTVRFWDTDAAGVCAHVLHGPFPVRAQCRPAGGAGSALLTVAHDKYWSMWDIVADGEEVEVIPKETEALVSVGAALVQHGSVKAGEDEVEDEEEDEMIALRKGTSMVQKKVELSSLNAANEEEEEEDEMQLLKRK